MKVVILAGGLGTRISEHTKLYLNHDTNQWKTHNLFNNETFL